VRRFPAALPAEFKPDELMTNVSNEQLRAYLATFHEVYRRRVDEYIPSQYRDYLLRLKHLPGSLIAAMFPPCTASDTSIGPAKPERLRFPRGESLPRAKTTLKLTNAFLASLGRLFAT
jgi:hypothetical protein